MKLLRTLTIKSILQASEKQLKLDPGALQTPNISASGIHILYFEVVPKLPQRQALLFRDDNNVRDFFKKYYLLMKQKVGGWRMLVGFICIQILFCFPQETEVLLYFPGGMLHTEQNNISA